LGWWLPPRSFFLLGSNQGGGVVGAVRGWVGLPPKKHPVWLSKNFFRTVWPGHPHQTNPPKHTQGVFFPPPQQSPPNRGGCSVVGSKWPKKTKTQPILQPPKKPPPKFVCFFFFLFWPQRKWGKTGNVWNHELPPFLIYRRQPTTKQKKLFGGGGFRGFFWFCSPLVFFLFDPLFGGVWNTRLGPGG